jgi:hypothetical protein
VVGPGLKALRSLTELELNDTLVSDTGLRAFKDLKKLTKLSLIDCRRVTDTGLKELRGLENLTELRISGTEVTDAGLRELQRSLPRCIFSR